MRRFVRIFAILALLGCFSPAKTPAHPYGPDFYSLRSSLRVDARGFDVIVVVEVPAVEVLRSFLREYGRRDDYPQEMIDRFVADQFSAFAKTLSVRLDGQPVPGRWERVDDPRNGKAGEGFFVFMMRFAPGAGPALAGPSASIEVVAGAFPDEKVFLSAFAEALEPWLISRNSATDVLGDLPANADFNTCLSCWSLDASLRTLRVDLTRAPAPRPGGAEGGGGP